MSDIDTEGLEIEINEDNGFSIILVGCPFCNRWFAIEADYYYEIDNVIHCPICCMEVRITGVENEQ